MPEMREKPSAIPRERFIALYGGVYEHSPHFAQGVWPLAASGALDTLEGFAGALRSAVDASGREAQLALIRAHPDLAGRVKLSPDSASEQAGAGLDHCSAAELETFLSLNTQYKEKFGFPFIKAVRGFKRQQILEEFGRRLGNDPDTEFATALAEIHKIARLRLGDMAVSSYAAIDRQIQEWAGKHALLVASSFAGAECRSVHVSSEAGDCFQIWIEPPAGSGVGVHAEFIDGPKERDLRADWIVLPADIGPLLEEALASVFTWMEPSKRHKPR
jgi:OHCU decarboxylase